MPPARECLSCRQLTRNGARCPTCTTHRDQARGTTAQRGYNSPWRRLVAAAMQTQRDAYGTAYCVDCGLTEAEGKTTGNPLSGDHRVWPAVTIADVDVVCRRDNSRRGALRKTRRG